MEDVGHAVWSFSIPKMLRRYFLFHRELLTELARAGYETVHELMAAAVDDSNVRVGMVASIRRCCMIPTTPKESASYVFGAKTQNQWNQ